MPMLCESLKHLMLQFVLVEPVGRFEKKWFGTHYSFSRLPSSSHYDA